MFTVSKINADCTSECRKAETIEQAMDFLYEDRMNAISSFGGADKINKDLTDIGKTMYAITAKNGSVAYGFAVRCKEDTNE